MYRRKFIKFLNLIKYPLYPILLIFLIFLFKDLNRFISSSKFFLYFISFIFILIIFIFIFLILYLIYYEFKRLDKSYFLTFDFYLYIFIIFISFIFIFSFDNLTGRYNILHFFLGNIFDEKIFQGTLQIHPRTFLLSFFSFLSLFDITITTFNLYFINKIISSIFLVVVFITGKKLFNDNIIAFILFLFFLFANSLKYNFSSIEPLISAVFFSYLCILTFIIYIKKNEKIYFLLSCSSLIIACFLKYELSFFLFLPFLFYYSINKKIHKKCFNILLPTIIIISFIFMCFFSHFTHQQGDDLELLGKNFEEKNLRLLIFNSFDIAKHNLFINKDINFYNITPLTIISILVCFYLFISFFFNYPSKLDISNYSFLFYGSFFILILVFNIFFSIEGLSVPEKIHSIFYLSELILFIFIFQNIYFKIFKTKLFFYFSLFFLLIFFVIITPLLTFHPFNYNYHGSSIMFEENKYLKDNINLQKDCFILKRSNQDPLIDYMLGHKKVVYLSNFNYLQENCYYYYYQYNFSEEIINYFYFEYMPMSKIDNLFSNCTKKKILEKNYNYQNTKLFKYDC